MTLSTPHQNVIAKKKNTTLLEATKKLDSLIKNETWAFIEPPPSRCVISSKLVFRAKSIKIRCNPIRFKVKACIYYNDIFTSIITWSTLKRIIPLCNNIDLDYIVQNQIFLQRTKHIEAKYYFVQERIFTRKISFKYIVTKLQHVDIFTKKFGQYFNN
uniref:Reverse transcriptase Ty1/copia-type domain-containing protein n=1 Tax=Physcomitrium patens TaxID=3218 RepID=A0A2K1IH14_PHYPA|nr:hypothetical protein PHYPA_029157 [Physcomitrium patens]